MTYTRRMLSWGRRFKQHMSDTGWTQQKLGKAMGITQGALSHWLTGKRDINLRDFMDLCMTTKADPAFILFGKPNIPQELVDRLSSSIREALTVDPTANPDYKEFSKRLVRPKAKSK